MSGAKKFIKIDSMFEALNKINLQLKVSENQILNAWALSKTPVVRERDINFAQDFQRLEYHELLEFVARIACFKFEGSDQEGLTLSDKIILTLEDFFSFTGVHARNPKNPLDKNKVIYMQKLEEQENQMTDSEAEKP